MNEQLIVVSHSPVFEDVRRVRVHITPHVIAIEGTNAGGVVISVQFSPLQALRLTSTDCYSVPKGWQIILNKIAVVQNSRWLEELRATLKQADVGSKCLEDSKHFFLAVDDMIIEFVARAWRLD